MVERKRTQVLNVRLLEAETDMVNALAEREGLSVSEWIRTVIRREHALAFAASKPRKPKRK